MFQARNLKQTDQPPVDSSIPPKTSFVREIKKKFNVQNYVSLICPGTHFKGK
jgi:hypothetical protein